MIIYDKLWALMERENVSQYKLVHSGIGNATLERLKKNQPVNIETINKLCKILHCKIEDIAEYVDEESET